MIKKEFIYLPELAVGILFFLNTISKFELGLILKVKFRSWLFIFWCFKNYKKTCSLRKMKFKVLLAKSESTLNTPPPDKYLKLCPGGGVFRLILPVLLVSIITSAFKTKWLLYIHRPNLWLDGIFDCIFWNLFNSNYMVSNHRNIWGQKNTYLWNQIL